MRWSQAHIPTLRDDPADAEAASHRLLTRAGYIRQLMAGVYSLLPLAVRVRAKIARIIRSEMDSIGGQEFLLPALHPAEVWQKSGRWDQVGEEMFRLKDRRQSDLALGMTHEEVFSTLALELASYRDLPQIWYQIQTKFRDEPRPKSGLLRTREFTMKDSYSFDIDEAGLDRAFDSHHQAYSNIFRRLGLDAISVAASSGLMGGSGSVEFIVRTEAGEDLIVACPTGDYAANMEAASARLDEISDEPAELDKFPTPGVKTIDDLARFEGGAPADRQVKSLAYFLDGEFVLVLLRGDHALVEQKLSDHTGALEIRPAVLEEIKERLGAEPGSLGAVGVSEFRIVADSALRGRANMTTGANDDGFHLRGVDVDRDLAITDWADLRAIEAGEPCVECGTPLEILRGIEVGHIFKLGKRYAAALGAEVLAEEGTATTIVMGSYGIGLERSLAALAESYHDEVGLKWPMQVAPFEVVISVIRTDDAATMEAAEQIYRSLVDGGVEVLLDDRDERPGVKFADSELIGIPLRVTVGPRGVSEKNAELYDRRSGGKQDVALDKAVDTIVGLVEEGREAT